MLVALPTLAELIDALWGRHMSLDEARRRISADGALLRLIAALAGATAQRGQALITFEQDAQVGDVQIRDVAGGDIIHYHITIIVALSTE